MHHFKKFILSRKILCAALFLILLCAASALVYAYRLPENRVLRAVGKTFWNADAPLSLKQPIQYLETGEYTLDLSLVLNQLETPFLIPALSDKISMLEGLTLESDIHYSMLEEKLDGELIFYYLYKPYLNAMVYAKQDNLYVKAPSLLENYLKIDTFGIPVFPDQLFKVRSCFAADSAKEEFSLEDVEIIQTDDSEFRLQFADGSAALMEIGADGLVSSLSYQNDSIDFYMEKEQITLNTSFQSPIDASDCQVSLKGSYLPGDTEGNPGIQLDSLDIIHMESGLALNLNGQLSLKPFEDIGPEPDGKIYDLFHLTASETALLSAKVLKNMLTTELAPFLPYLQ